MKFEVDKPTPLADAIMEHLDDIGNALKPGLVSFACDVGVRPTAAALMGISTEMLECSGISIDSFDSLLASMRSAFRDAREGRTERLQ